MKTHYNAFYTAPAHGEPFTVTESFRMVQLRHIPHGETSARILCHHLQTVAIPEQVAAELIKLWNTQARGKIIYTLAENN